MRALSLGLVKGVIDEVDQKVHMTWVQPRVLNTEQVPTFVYNVVGFFRVNNVVSFLTKKNVNLTLVDLFSGDTSRIFNKTNAWNSLPNDVISKVTSLGSV